MKKKRLIILLSTLIPLFIIMVSATWIILSQSVFAPSYDPNSNSVLFQAYDGQTVTYNSFGCQPTNQRKDLVTDDSNITFAYRKADSNTKYKNGLPINAGTYDILVKDTSGKYMNDVVRFTVDKATPFIDGDVQLSSTTIYEGDPISLTSNFVFNVNETTTKAVEGTTDVVINNLPTSYSKSTDNELTANLTITFTPTGDLKDNFNEATINASATLKVNCVAYINSTYYGTIEKALGDAAENSNKTIYVIPNLTYNGQKYDIHIRSDCTVQKGVTLTLPYKDEVYYNEAELLNQNTTYAFENPAKYRVINVIIDENQTLNNYGVINIGGLISGSNGGGSPASQTAGNYAQISLDNNAKIKSYGKIECYGFIDECNIDNGSSLELSSYTDSQGSKYYGELKIPFSIIEHRGGSIFYGMYKNLKTAPFNRFFMQNVTSKLEINSGCKLFGFADLYAADQSNCTNIALIGTDNNSFINLSKNACLEAKYNKATKIVKIDTYGSYSLNSLALTIKVQVIGNVSLSTNKVLFPISWYQNVELHPFKENKGDATVTSSEQGIKILPGGKLKINKGVNVNIPSVCVYDNLSTTDWTWMETVTNVGCSVAYENRGNGELIVEGILNATSIAGVIKTSNSDATNIIKTNNSITVYELASSKGSFIFTSVTYFKHTYEFTIETNVT